MINLSQGVRLGFWRALPFAVGTGFGIASVLVVSALGLGAAIEALPWLRRAMLVATLGFLLYLAWKIATAGPLTARAGETRLGFLAGVGFQWINPKTWAVSMTMAATYLPADPEPAVAFLAGAIFCAVAWTTQPVWIGFGEALRQFLADPLRARVFNAVMAALLLAATLPILAASW